MKGTNRIMNIGDRVWWKQFKNHNTYEFVVGTVVIEDGVMKAVRDWLADDPPILSDLYHNLYLALHKDNKNMVLASKVDPAAHDWSGDSTGCYVCAAENAKVAA